MRQFSDDCRLLVPLLVVSAVFFVGKCGLPRSAAADELSRPASWRWPDVSIYEQHLLSYLDQQQASEEIRAKVLVAWNETASQSRGPDLLDRLLQTASLLDSRIQELTQQLCDPAVSPTHPRDLDWLTSEVPGWMQDTVRLASGRAFAQRRMYDEALETLSGLELVQVCDPASLIFYRATCQHHLMQRKECIANIELLMERQDELPVRFSQVSQLMKADIEPLEADSLDEVSRIMRDVERRLELGRAGARVRGEEQEIVDKLDKLIDKIEQQMQQQRQQQQAQQNSPSQQNQPTPMQDSQIAGGTGPGDVENKDSGNRAGWGNLPPAERQQALQRLTEELPSHYRDVIEGYFRQLAKDKK